MSGGRTLRSPARRLRVLRVAVAVLGEALDAPGLTEEDRTATLEEVARRLGRVGLAATAHTLDVLVDEVDRLARLRSGDLEVESFVDRFYGSRSEAVEWLEDRIERTIRAGERLIAGTTD